MLVKQYGCCKGDAVVVLVALTTGEVAWLSDEDADLARLSWQRSTHGHLKRNLRYGQGKRTNQELARIIMERLLARPLTPADIVEHVDGDLLNNRRENLRLLGGLAGGLLWSDRPGAKIEPVEILTWSWKRTRYGLLRGLLRGAVVGLVIALLLGLLVMMATLLEGEPGGSLQEYLLFFGRAGLNGGLLGGLLGGFSGQQLPKREELSPNEGIRRSVRHGLISGFASGGVGAGLVGLLLIRSSGLFTVFVAAVFALGLIGLPVALFNGLAAALRHALVRFWLARSGVFPWQAVPFLEDATTRILLKRVGGGYSFFHGLLLDYFADMYAGASSTSPAAQSALPSPS